MIIKKQMQLDSKLIEKLIKMKNIQIVKNIIMKDIVKIDKKFMKIKNILLKINLIFYDYVMK